MNAVGDRLVNTTPGDWSDPVAWSLAGAVLGAIREPRVQSVYDQCAADVIRQFYGVLDPVEWACDPDRIQEEVVAVAAETERRLFSRVGRDA